MFLGLWRGFIFLNETSILTFAELLIFHSVLMRTSLEKLSGKSLVKRYNACYMFFGIWPKF